MTKSTGVVSMVALLAGIAFASNAGAQPRPPHDGPPCGPGGPPRLEEIVAEHADEIGLDAATVDAIQQIVADASADLEALHDAMRSAIDGGDEDAIREAHEALHQAMHAVMEQVRALLTDGQWEALRQFLPPPPPPPER